MKKSEWIEKSTNVLDRFSEKYGAEVADEQTVSDFEQVCAEIYDTNNFQAGLELLQGYKHNVMHRLYCHPRESEATMKIRQIASHLETYLRDKCFCMPTLAIFNIEGFIISSGGISISHYNPITQKAEALVPTYMDNRFNLIETTTGKILYLYDEETRQHTPVKDIDTGVNPTVPAPEPQWQFQCLTMSNEEHELFFEELISQHFLTPDTPKEVWQYICGQSDKKPATLTPLRWCDTTESLLTLVQHLFFNTPNIGYVTATAFVDTNGNPISAETISDWFARPELKYHLREPAKGAVKAWQTAIAKAMPPIDPDMKMEDFLF